MAARPLDVAPAGPVTLPDSGWGRGWEPLAVVLLTLLLLSFGLVTLYSASSVLALRQNLPDTYFVLRQAAGAAVGRVALAVCGDLPAALGCVLRDESLNLQSRLAQPEDFARVAGPRLRQLLNFAVSEEYLTLRERVGMAIVTES